MFGMLWGQSAVPSEIGVFGMHRIMDSHWIKIISKRIKCHSHHQSSPSPDDRHHLMPASGDSIRTECFRAAPTASTTSQLHQQHLIRSTSIVADSPPSRQGPSPAHPQRLMGDWWWEDWAVHERRDMKAKVEHLENEMYWLRWYVAEVKEKEAARSSELDSLREQIQDLQQEVRRLKEQGPPAHSSDARSSEAAPSPSPTPPLLPSRSSSRGPSPAPGRNEACVHRGAGKVVSDQRPRTGKEMWSWAGHLQSTLFRDHPWAQWEEIYNVLTQNEADFEVRDCSTTQANRTFTLVCTHCWASCKGWYGSSVAEAKRVEARRDLTKFILDTDALAEGEEA